MTTYLVCEGKTGREILQAIIIEKFGREVLIEEAGSRSALGSLRRYLAERAGTTGAYIIEDRDFAPAEEVEKRWRKEDATRWRWRRHEIDNYLLDPRLVAYAFRELKKTPGGGGRAAKLPDDPKPVLALLQRLAEPLLADYAGQLTCHQLRFYKGDTTNTALTCKNKPSSGDWLDFLKTECERLRQDCDKIVADDTFNFAAIEKRYHNVLARLKEPAFFNTQQFLVDMPGEALLSALCTYINQAVGLNLKREDVREFLLGALKALYEPGFFDPDDFDQLAARLNK